MKAFISCSEPCKPETFALFYDSFAHCGVHKGVLQTCYAMAETVFAVSQSVLGQPVKVVNLDMNRLAKNSVAKFVKEGTPNSQSFLSCGPVIKGLTLCQKSDWKQKLTIGKSAVVSEILISGDFLFDGYYNNQEATHLALVDGVYSTGDMGFIYEDELYICGRLKEMMIVHGKNFYCNDIEAEINMIDGIIAGRNVVFGEYNSQSASEEAIAIIETEETDKASLTKLKRAVRERINTKFNLTLSHIEFVNRGWLSKTTSGKISRSSNLEKFRTLKKEVSN
jgi:acyl-CoA synthetase (AMP-forming)/AMP-acid ligase II